MNVLLVVAMPVHQTLTAAILQVATSASVMMALMAVDINAQVNKLKEEISLYFSFTIKWCRNGFE